MKKGYETRKDLRLKHYDYSSPGAYFITICTHNRKETLAHVVGAIHVSILSKAVGYIKMNASRKIHQIFGKSPIWQRGYHDHIIRNRASYEKIAKYIYEDPKSWQYDCFNTTSSNYKPITQAEN